MSDPANEAQRELITFRVGEQFFCVDIMAVREIRGWSPPTPLPQSPAFVPGVINLRGRCCRSSTWPRAWGCRPPSPPSGT